MTYQVVYDARVLTGGETTGDTNPYDPRRRGLDASGTSSNTGCVDALLNLANQKRLTQAATLTGESHKGRGSPGTGGPVAGLIEHASHEVPAVRLTESSHESSNGSEDVGDVIVS